MENSSILLQDEEIPAPLPLISSGNADSDNLSQNTFKGLYEMKKSRRERHRKELDKYEKLMDNITEAREKEVLQTVINSRDSLESVDQTLSAIYKDLQDASYLIIRDEKDLMEVYDKIRGFIRGRDDIIEQLGKDLESIEINRAKIISKELRKLVDTLISIAHELPDNIEHVIEDEANDLNHLLVQNRISHAELLLLLKQQQLEKDIESRHNWENARMAWRKLRHDKALNDYRLDIRSQRFLDPQDRAEYLESMKSGQLTRQQTRQELLDKLASITADSISTSELYKIKQEFVDMNEFEITSIQQCYDDLQDMRKNTLTIANKRTDDFRKELHVYAALENEPDHPSLAKIFASELSNEQYSDLWRLGGGLKQDITSISHDICSSDIVYNPHVDGIITKLDLIECGFDIRAIMITRGRENAVDRICSFISKLRTVSRAEIPDVVESLITMLEEMNIDAFPRLFTDTLSKIICDMNKSLEQAKLKQSEQSNDINPLTRMLSLTGSNFVLRSNSLTNSTNNVQRTLMSKTTKKTLETESFSKQIIYIDPMDIKQYHKTLGILFFSSNLSEKCKETIKICQKNLIQQKKSNQIIDEIVVKYSEKILNRIGNEYSNFIDAIVNHLESQAIALSYVCANTTNFYILIGKRIESNKIHQFNLDEKSKDDLWDLSEEYRLQSEDREEELLKACQALRQSINEDQLTENFNMVLKVLDIIQESYTKYHERACYTSDQYELSMIREYRSYLRDCCEIFYVKPMESHAINAFAEELYEKIIRMNLKFYENDDEAKKFMESIQSKASIETANLTANQAMKSDDTGSKKKSMMNRKNSIKKSQQDIAMNDNLLKETATNESIDSESVYCSPLINNIDKAILFAGKYHQLMNVTNVDNKFRVFGGIPSDDIDEKASESPTSDQMTADHGNRSERRSSVIHHHESNDQDVNNLIGDEKYPFIRKNCMIPLSQEEIASLDDDERFDYETSLLKYFIDLGDVDIIIQDYLTQYPTANHPRRPLSMVNAKATASTANTSKGKGKNDKSNEIAIPTHWTMDEQVIDMYIYHQKYFQEINLVRQEQNQRMNRFIQIIEFEPKQILEIYQNFRDNVITTIEIEITNRINQSEMITNDRKMEYNEELEERLRSHWPKRGRVETQIKQPRLNELRNHQEKLWRMIELTQNRMKELQNKIFQIYGDCNYLETKYIQEINDLKGQLGTENGIKSLAALQALDVKARTCTMNYQSEFEKKIKFFEEIIQIEPKQVVHRIEDFKSSCPELVIGQSIDELYASQSRDGYSSSELEEINLIIQKQNLEIEEIIKSWNDQINDIKTNQINSLTSHQEFIKKYDLCAHELAMAEGLGQRFGAPRRRAQERVRTELNRDEMNANSIDNMLNQLEGLCEQENQVNPSMELSHIVENALGQVMTSWNLLQGLRSAFLYRAQYLKVWQSNPLPNPVIPWINKDNLMGYCDDLSKIENFQEIPPLDQSIGCLEDIVLETEQICRKETKELYEQENKSKKMPESLEIWLKEMHEKILGRHGYRETAWKKLWHQIDRFEVILRRKSGLNGRDSDETHNIETNTSMSSYGITSVCFHSLLKVFVVYIQLNRYKQEQQLINIVNQTSNDRDLNERSLRPRLGSEGAFDELNALNDKENHRSNVFLVSIQTYKSDTIKIISEETKRFISNLLICSQGFLQFIDHAARQQLIQVPPDIIVPKQRMSIKQMRKAQKLRQLITTGQREDRSNERVWQPIHLNELSSLLKKAEESIIQSSDSPDVPQVDSVQEKGGNRRNSKFSKSASVMAPKVAKNAPKQMSMVPLPTTSSALAESPVNNDNDAFEQSFPVPATIDDWTKKMIQLSQVKAGVSTAHRVIIQERDDVVESLTRTINEAIMKVNEDCDRIITEETSWRQRWTRQVAFLRKGKL